MEAWLSQLRQRGKRGLVGHVAGVEQQRRLFLMKIRQLLFQLHVIPRGAGNVARAAGAGADIVQRLVHGLEHVRVLGHAEIVVGAPDDHLLHVALVVIIKRAGIIATLAPELGEIAVAPFLVQFLDGFAEDTLVIDPGHDAPHTLPAASPRHEMAAHDPQSTCVRDNVIVKHARKGS